MRAFVSLFILFAIATTVRSEEILPTDWETIYRQHVPEGVFSKSELARMVFYDRTHGVPQEHQIRDGGLPGWHPFARNISANRSEPHGNPNKELPWVTGGLDGSPNGSDYKAIILPEKGELQFTSRRLTRLHSMSHDAAGNKTYSAAYDDQPTELVIYPIGTKLVEFLMVDLAVVFEVRVLEKIASNDPMEPAKNWRPKVFRAVRDRRCLLDATKGTSYQAKLVKHYGEALPVERLNDKHEHPVLDVWAPVDNLPEMTLAEKKLVNWRPFVEVTDWPWVETKSGKAYGPSGGFVADNFRGSHFASETCMKCHATVAKHASDFDLFHAPYPPYNLRDWYGRVRGSDGIFSMPPQRQVLGMVQKIARGNGGHN